MLVAGYDVRKIVIKINLLCQLYFVYLYVYTLQSQGPHLYQTCPSSNFYDCKAMSIGARSQVQR